MTNPFKRLYQIQNTIVPDRCYFEGGDSGVKLRFAISGEVSPTILLDPVLAGEMYRVLHNYLKQLQEVQALTDKETIKL